MFSETVVKVIRMKDCPASIGAGRMRHSMVAYQGALYIYGGYNEINQKDKFLSDLLKYDIKTQSWSTEVTDGTSPGPICGHSAVVYKSSMFVFGGNSTKLSGYSNRLYEYRFATKVWYNIEFAGCNLPEGRMSHSAIVYDDRLWIFGGFKSYKDGNYDDLNNMWTIRLWGANNWEKVKDSDQFALLSTRYSPITVVRDEMYAVSVENAIQSFRFNLEENKWSNPKDTTSKDKIHAMTAFDDGFVIFGNGLKALQCYDINSQIWSDISQDTNSDIPFETTKYVTVVFEGAIYTFGGISENLYSSALYKVQLQRRYRECSVHEDYEKILTSSLLTDVEFAVGENDIKFPAHISIVAARSESLRACIQNALVTQKKSVSVKDLPMIQVKIPNAVPESFEILLNYIYTDRIVTLKDGQEKLLLYFDLYSLAVQFNVNNLKHMIIEQLTDQFLDSTITSSNILDILAKAHNINFLTIEEYCLNFIVNDINLENIVKSKDFENLDPSLILRAFRKKMESAKVPTHILSSTDISANITNHSSLTQDMEVFLNEIGPEFSDVTLLVGEYSIPSHKCILAARSSYFEAKFRSFDSPDSIVHIQIGEIKPSKEAFDIVLKFIYYDDANNIPIEHSFFVFLAADYYGFRNCYQLQEMIKTNVKRYATLEQMLDMLEDAHLTKQTDLKNSLLEIIIERYPDVASWPKHTLSPEIWIDIAIIQSINLKNMQINTEAMFD